MTRRVAFEVGLAARGGGGGSGASPTCSTRCRCPAAGPHGSIVATALAPPGPAPARRHLANLHRAAGGASTRSDPASPWNPCRPRGPPRWTRHTPTHAAPPWRRRPCAPGTPLPSGSPPHPTCTSGSGPATGLARRNLVRRRLLRIVRHNHPGQPRHPTRIPRRRPASTETYMVSPDSVHPRPPTNEEIPTRQWGLSRR